MTQAEKAQRLLQLHHGETPLVLVNAWDAASAAIVEQAGFPAIATSSAALANSLGCADGQNLQWHDMLGAIRRISSAVQVPVTADIEAGFSSSVQQLSAAIDDVIAAGAVGVNLEDALPGHGDRGPLYAEADQVSRIQTARKAGEKRGVHLVINARTDAYWQAGVPREEALRNTLERGKTYLKAGADCIFIPGLGDSGHIQAIVQECSTQRSGDRRMSFHSGVAEIGRQAHQYGLWPHARGHGPASSHRPRSPGHRDI